MPGRRISIFLSIFDVHVNRSPVAGKHHGHRVPDAASFTRRCAAARRQKMSRTRSTCPASDGEVVFKQIAGWVARRIVCWKSVGDSVTRGERVGMIRFGSRMDIWLPDRVEILVRPGQHVAGGTSVLARWK